MQTPKMLLGLCLGALSASMSFAQPNQRWVYPPYSINMSGTSPIFTTLPGASSGEISNGAYDANGNLLFYLKDLNVYSATSQLKGKLPIPSSGGHGATWRAAPEIDIVPVPGSCSRFYVIYPLHDSTGGFDSLSYATIDTSSGTPVAIGPAFGSTLSATYYSQNVLAWRYFHAQGLAVSKLTSGNATRYLFTVGFNGSPNLPRSPQNYGGIFRWTIDAAGIHSPIVIANDVVDLGNYYGYLTWLTVGQMSLSDDQTRLAWGGGTRTYNNQQSVFEIKVNPANYSYVPGSFQRYFIPFFGTASGSHFVSGVEYAAGTNRLYASMRDGLYCIASYGSAPFLIPGSTSRTKQPLSAISGSQLQYVKSTGKIVGVGVTNTSANTGTLFSIDPSNNNVVSISSTALRSRYIGPTVGDGAFTIPDLVDIASYPPAPIISGNTTICYGGSTTLCANYQDNPQYTVVWSYHAGAAGNDIEAQCITVTPTTNTTYSFSVTDDTTGCKGSVSGTVVVARNEPDFTYQVSYAGAGSNYFTINATPVAPYSNGIAGFGDLWVVEQVDTSGNPIPGTNTSTGTSPNPTCWWVYPTANTFRGFDGTKSSSINSVTCPNPSPGKFLNGGTYRIGHGIWNNLCGWAQTSHTITVIGHRVIEKTDAAHD